MTGKTAHAADPEDGLSPALAVAQIIPALDALGRGGALDDDFRLVTITHAQIGEPTFGVAPGDAEIYATLRTTADAGMENFETSARNIATKAAQEFGVFGWDAKAAMLCLGPGEDYAALHNPDYDFPDDLIPVGAAIFARIARDLLG
ncbi:Peptidase family M20/M25/M40 [Octadecabacter ascidiaceicola]|uniref:Peptidase family M20/M25/M40 n=1 Tax=Octadecabacter ascidiaceicola TaxID=1655543 RepID=A0A238K885_9RHOB|nr:Peptidase family M20/M25/M40 [Octadecabacter ascidiaceicola]